ncbi:MAG: ferrochelatase [Thermomicrobiales bacterium]
MTPAPDSTTTATNHVLMMAYGGPDKIEDVPDYLRDVRSYRPTSDELIHEIAERYERIGGRSPILELTQAQAAALEAKLNDDPVGPRWNVHVGMRHWHPFIKDVLAELEGETIAKVVGLVMAPHYSRMSIGAYYKRVEAAGSPIQVVPIERWHLLPGYLDALADRVGDALQKFPAEVRKDVPVIFSAHSLPEKIQEWDDPYPRELQETVAAVAERISPQPYTFAYQSAAMTPDPWLGPDVAETVERYAAEGKQHILVAPVGFVTEHVEILYDIDVDFMQQAEKLGVRLERIEMLNDHPLMIAALADLVRARAAQAGMS